jgi:hypothetical protein
VLVETRSTSVAWERKSKSAAPTTYPEVAVEIGTHRSCPSFLNATRVCVVCVVGCARHLTSITTVT